MARWVFLLAGLACLFSARGQQAVQVKAEYTAARNAYDPETAEERTCALFVQGPRSMFLYLPPSTSSEKDVRIETDEMGNPKMKMKISSQDSLNQRYFLDQTTEKRLISRELLYLNGRTQAYIVEETLPPIRWVLINEFRELGQFRCQKATSRFRGRTYTAWFSPDIPVSAGPWKLSGLPGLILEAYDEERAVQFRCRSVEFPYAGTLDISPPTEGEPVSLPEFIALKDKTVDNFVNYLLSKLPRGASVEISESSGREADLEREFEFEQEKTKKN